MARILIAYATETGTARECAQKLAESLRGTDVTLADLRDGFPDPAEYDLSVIGSSIRFGKLCRPMRAYLKAYGEALCKVPHAVFLCCAIGHAFEEYCEREFPPSLLRSAVAVMTFGGVLKKEQNNLRDRIIVRMMRSKIAESEFEDGEYTPVLPGILPENIGKMATYLREEIAKHQSER